MFSFFCSVTVSDPSSWMPYKNPYRLDGTDLFGILLVKKILIAFTNNFVNCFSIHNQVQNFPYNEFMRLIPRVLLAKTREILFCFINC